MTVQCPILIMIIGSLVQKIIACDSTNWLRVYSLARFLPFELTILLGDNKYIMQIVMKRRKK